jgi:hypothetical protein
MTSTCIQIHPDPRIAKFASLTCPALLDDIRKKQKARPTKRRARPSRRSGRA